MARSKASRPESSSWMLKNGIFGLLCVAQEEPFLSELLDSIGVNDMEKYLYITWS